MKHNQKQKQNKENIKVIYSCQCGKQYNNYSAIYLHFFRIHKVKISQKNNNILQKKKIGEIERYRYFYSKISPVPPTTDQKHINILNQYLNEFVHSVMNEQDKYLGFFICAKLHEYLLEQQTYVNKPFEHMKICSIPSYFNDFIQHNYEMLRAGDLFRQNCQILCQLGRWLVFMGASDIFLEFQKPIPINQKLEINTDNLSIIKIENPQQ